MKKHIISMLFVTALIFISCNKDNKIEQKDESKVKQKEYYAGYESIGDSIIIPTFDIELDMTPLSDQKIINDQESIIIQAYFSGIPIDTNNQDYLDYGEYGIAQHRVELFGKDRIAHFENFKIAKKEIDALSDTDFTVLINIFSGRKTTSDNLMNCDILQEKISKIRDKKHTLWCKLIYGDEK